MKKLNCAQCVLVASMVLAPAVWADEIGPWTVTPPDSAVVIAGGGGSWGWLNVVNAAVSVNDALTGSPMLDDGYANADVGTTIEVTFGGGIVNGSGPDFVLFDAQFDAGEYVVSSDFDGFVATTAPGFTLTGESRDYYYEHNGNGPFPADIWGGEVDLSSIGVPDGTSVTRIRFTTTNTGGDPVACGAIGDCLTLTLANFVAGETATWTMTGGTEGEKIAVVYGNPNGQTVVNGFGGYCATFGLGGVNQSKVIGFGTTIGGVATVEKKIPVPLKGLMVSMQAAERNTCPGECMSNIVTQVIQ